MFDRKQKGILIALGLIFLTIVTICIYMYQNRQIFQKVVFDKPEFDENMVEGIPSGLDPAWNYNDLQIEEGKKLTLCATPALDKKNLQLYLTSDQGNDFWLKVRVLDKKKQVLGECGLIKPGSYIPSILLKKKVKSGKQLTLYVMMYEKDTYQSAGAATIGVIVL